MANNNLPEQLNWEIPEYIKHERSRRWYIVSGVIVLFFILISVITPNYFFDQPNVLFLGIVVIGAFVLYLNDRYEPLQIEVQLNDEGIVLGNKFYDYDEIKDFAVLYKPSQDLRHLYIEFKAAVRPRLSIDLMEQDPLVVRQFLLRYLPEDLERTNRPTSETLAKILKL